MTLLQAVSQSDSHCDLFLKLYNLIDTDIIVTFIIEIHGNYTRCTLITCWIERKLQHTKELKVKFLERTKKILEAVS